jgi:hypothetical protein
MTDIDPNHPSEADEIDHRPPWVRDPEGWVKERLEAIYPDAGIREAALRVLAGAIEAAHQANPRSWSVTQYPALTRLNVGRPESLVLRKTGLHAVVDAGHVAEATRTEIEATGRVFPEGTYTSLPNGIGVLIPPERIDDLYPLVRDGHLATIAEAARQVRQTPYRRSHTPAVLDYLRHTLDLAVPDPQLPPEPPPGEPAPAAATLDPAGLIARSLAAAGLRFSDWETASFYTALQAKGFVILSGISGTGKTKLVQHFATLLPQPADVGATEPQASGEPPATGQATPNWLFLPVRPDWRDAKSLLGYYNPLTGRYEWTPFLHFLVRAEASYRRNDGLAWFVILDEMNLAHVEHYFADLLSVLESGRDRDGYAREPLRFVCPDDAQGPLPPAELHLPPNLYIAGTVNMDETTHAFSPKVLDRAFTIELVDVDFRGYPPAPTREPFAPSAAERLALLDAFTAGGRFARVEKDIVATYVANHPGVREWLEGLNGLLRPYSLHFGYRVFDEIITFLSAAAANRFFDPIATPDAALDAAVFMKVLPKFHGSRGRLEEPLLAVLAWCQRPAAPNVEALRRRWLDAEAEADPLLALAGQDHLPRTAARVRRMLFELRVDGFTAFG